MTEAYLSVLLLIFPLWIGVGGYQRMTETKYALFRWSAVIYLGLMLLLLLELSLVGKSREVMAALRPFSVTQVCIAGYIACCGLSALLSDYRSEVWRGAGRYEGLETILLYAALFFMISRFGKFKKRHLWLLGAAVLINAAIGVMQYAGQNPFALFPAGYTYHDAFVRYSGAFMGTLGNVDLLSAFLSLTVPLFYACYVTHEKSAAFLVPFTAGVFLLLLSGVSAGVVGIAAGLLATFPFLASTKHGFTRVLLSGAAAAVGAAAYSCLSFTYENSVTALFFRPGPPAAALLLLAALLSAAAAYIDRGKSKVWDSRRAKKALTGAVLGAVAIALAVLWAYPFSEGVLSEAHQLLRGNVSPEFGSSRIKIWQESWKLLPGHLFFGGGPDTLANRMTFSFTRYIEAIGVTVNSYIDNAHNDYLNILVNTGLFSLLFYLGALASAAVRAAQSSDEERNIPVMATALLCYLVQIFFSFSLCIVSPFFWAFLGLLEASLLEMRTRRCLKKCVSTKN
ncbi:MAG TPA: O-antigen ligase family protein [Candidatus Acidoferrum sp.]|nr:O-antigen ligase family protein [Candidatus Acidoferrum sp.]